MAKTQTPLAERIPAVVPKLRAAAKEIHKASDELGKALTPIETILKALNLGVATWTLIAGHDDEDGSYWSREVGYAKVKSSWGLAIKTTNGHHGYDVHSEEVWQFNEAPRWIRVDAVGKLPDLLEALITRTEETTKTLRAKTRQAEEIAALLTSAAQAPFEEGGGE
jgi:hypothetical protein